MNASSKSARAVANTPRRRFNQAVAVGATIAGFPAIVRAQSKTITTTAFGGIYEKHYRTHVIEPWEKRSGFKVNLVTTGGADQWLTSAIVNKARPEIDLPFLSLPVTHTAIRTDGVFLDLDEKLIPNAKQIDPLFFDYFDRKAVGFNYAPYGLFYRSDQIRTAPTSWADLWRPEHAGKILLPDTTSGGAEETVVIAATLNGGGVTNLDPGWAALRRLKPAVQRFFKNNNEPVPILQRGEASIGAWYSARVFMLKDTGVPIEFVTPKEGAPIGVLSYHVARNSPQRDAVLDFVNFALSKTPQEGFGNAIEYGVCNREAVFTGRARERVTPHNQLMRIDWRKVEIAKISERFRREITS